LGSCCVLQAADQWRAATIASINFTGGVFGDSALSWTQVGAHTFRFDSRAAV
jgi:hypothetical protein